MPRITVVMPVYNSQKYVGEAIESIIEQTFTDWELIIINDCSTDEVEKVILSYTDDRIRYVKNETNKGFLYGLNYGINHATGEFIARLDDDDTCKPDRFKKQIDYLDQNPDVALVGTLNDEIIEGKHQNYKSVAISGAAAKFTELFTNACFAHSSFMMRRQFLIEHGIKYDTFKQTPDHHMILDICRFGNIATLDEVLVSYRIHPTQSTAVRSQKMKQTEEDRTRCLYIQDLPLDEHDKLYLKKGVCRDLQTDDDYESFLKAVEAYASLVQYDPAENVLGGLGLAIALCENEFSFRVLRIIRKSRFIDYKRCFGTTAYLKMIIKCLIRYRKNDYPPTFDYTETVERVDLG